jgi:hypothetical protein
LQSAIFFKKNEKKPKIVEKDFEKQEKKERKQHKKFLIQKEEDKLLKRK